MTVTHTPSSFINPVTHVASSCASDFYREVAMTLAKMTYSVAETRLTGMMRKVINRTSHNKRALSRIQELIAQSKTELTHGKRQVVLFEMLEELEAEIARL